MLPIFRHLYLKKKRKSILVSTYKNTVNKTQERLYRKLQYMFCYNSFHRYGTTSHSSIFVHRWPSPLEKHCTAKSVNILTKLSRHT